MPTAPLPGIRAADRHPFSSLENSHPRRPYLADSVIASVVVVREANRHLPVFKVINEKMDVQGVFLKSAFSSVPAADGIIVRHCQDRFIINSIAFGVDDLRAHRMTVHDRGARHHPGRDG